MGSPWGKHHSRDASSEDAPWTPGDSTHTAQPPWAHWTSNHNQWHHTTPTTTPQPYWPPKASDHASVTAAVSSATPQLSVPTRLPQKSLTHGALAAAVVVPVIFLLSLVGLAFLCFRRRGRQATAPDIPAVAALGMKDKLGSFRWRRDPPPPPAAAEAPVLMSERNNAYYTGLDTSSFGSRPASGEFAARESYEPPPPPYIHEPSPPGVDERARSPFDDPEEPHHITDDLRARREVRRSISGAYVADARSTTSQDERRYSDPFVSPVESPVSDGGVGYR